MEKEEESNLSTNIPVWERYLLTVCEAAQYYHIGEKKIRTMIDVYKESEFVLFVGNKALIKRKQFEDFLDKATTV